MEKISTLPPFSYITSKSISKECNLTAQAKLQPQSEDIDGKFQKS
jgi:hypothetical protein